MQDRPCSFSHKNHIGLIIFQFVAVRPIDKAS